MAKYSVTIAKTITFTKVVNGVEAQDWFEAECEAERIAKNPGFWDGIESETEVMACDYRLEKDQAEEEDTVGA